MAIRQPNDCAICGYWKPLCHCDGKPVLGIEIFKPMVYNDICETPILIESKKQLKEECSKRGLKACRLM